MKKAKKWAGGQIPWAGGQILFNKSLCFNTVGGLVVKYRGLVVKFFFLIKHYILLHVVGWWSNSLFFTTYSLPKMYKYNILCLKFGLVGWWSNSLILYIIKTKNLF
jgi:hypothetical protein